MELDDELCLCFHVSKRKVVNYLRIHQPRVPSQLADCGGAAHARCERRRLVSEVDGHEKWKRPPAWPANSERASAAAFEGARGGFEKASWRTVALEQFLIWRLLETALLDRSRAQDQLSSHRILGREDRPDANREGECMHR